MKSRFLLVVLLFVVFVGCKNQQSKSTQADAAEYTIVTLTKLVEGIAEYQDAKIEMEGLISHVCHSGGKFKIVADNGAVITVYPKDAEEKYDASLERKIVKVYGVASSQVLDAEHTCTHDQAENVGEGEHNHAEHEGCEHEKIDTKPIIIVTADKYEVIRDVDTEQ